MKDSDPPPLADPGSGAPPLLRDALAGARGRMPSPDDLARIATKLPMGSPPPGGASAPPPAGAAPAAAPPSVFSGALIGAALGALVSGTALLWDAKRDPASSTAPAARATALVDAPVPALEAPRTPSPREPSPAATTTPGSAPRPMQASASAPAPPADAMAEGAPVPANVGAGAVPPSAGAESEAHLLQRAHEALSASPAQALALTEEHASRFPSGSLGQEREVVAVQALVRLGRMEEARVRVARFVAAFPGSAHRSRLEALVAP